MTPAGPAVPVDTGRGSGERPLVVMALPACGGRAIGDNALRRAVAISQYFRPVVVSDSFPDWTPESVETILITPPRFCFLRRFCHVPNELGFAWAVRKALTTLQQREGVAFLLCHGYTLAWFTGRWFRRRTGVPFGMFMHGHIFERPKGTYDPRVTAFYRAIAPTCYRDADLLFALSPVQADLAVAAGARRERLVLAPNGLGLADVGIDPIEAEQKVAEWEPHKPLRLLYVGRLSVEKGVDVLLGACTRLLAHGLDFRLRIIGSGPEESRLRRQCAQTGLEGRVEFHNALPRRQLGEHYLAHDILLVPSRSEPLGNVALEGMAGGCVVVASDTGGLPSIVENQMNGLLVSPDDEEALTIAISTLADNEDLARRFAQAGYLQQRIHFSWPIIGKNIINRLSLLSAHAKGL